MYLKTLTATLVIAVTMVSSCAKEREGNSQTSGFSQATQSPLSGQEFLFENLSWQFYGVGSSFDHESYIQTMSRPELFPNVDFALNAIVSIKFDTASNWIEVNHGIYYNINMPVQYGYNIYSNNQLTVSFWPASQQLTGKKTSIKILYR